MSYVLTALLGAVVALASLATHRSGALLLLLAVVASLAAALALRATSRPRLAASYSVGWLVLFGVAATGRREGDYVLAADVAGYTLMAAAFLLVVIGVTSLRGRGRTSPA